MEDKSKYRLISWIVASVLSIGTFCACFFIKHDYSIVGWTDAFFYSAGIIILLFLLYLVTRAGVFDMFRFGVGDILYHMRPNPGERKYKDYVDYVQQKKDARAKNGVYPWPWLTFFLIFLVAFIVCYTVYRNGIASV